MNWYSFKFVYKIVNKTTQWRNKKEKTKKAFIFVVLIPSYLNIKKSQ